MPTYTYPEDRTGALVSNRLVNEPHVITYDNTRDYHFILPVFAPFYASSVRVYKRVGASRLPTTYGVDYHFGLHFVGASLSVAQEIYGAIVPLNITEDAVYEIEYQTLGGPWTLDLPGLTSAAADIAKNPRALSWEQLVNLPTMFSPTDHPWNFTDMVGQTDLVNAITQIAGAILNRSSDDTANHAKNLLNPHNTDKHQLDLGKVANFGPAGLIDAIGGQSPDTLITPATLRAVLDHLGVLLVSSNLQAMESHIGDTELHSMNKKKLGLENVSNFPPVSRDDIMRNARVQKYVTMDMLIEWMSMHGCSSDTTTKAPIPQGALLHSYCNSNYDRMGTYADGKGGTYESVIKTKDVDCGYQGTTPIAHPPAGTLLQQYCSGTTEMGLKADGYGGVVSEVLALNSAKCTTGSGYPPAGSVLGTVCEGTTLVRTIANGGGGSTFERVANSPECVNVVFPPKGTLVSYACRGFDRMGTYTDGSGGTYDAIITINSPDCGYVAPTTPPTQTFPPAGTVIGTSCNGYNKQEIRANGTGGTYNVTITVNSAECGYVATTAPTTAPGTTRTMQLSSTHSSLWVGDNETLSLVMSGWTPNTTYNLKFYTQSPGFANGAPYMTLEQAVTTDRSGNATWRLSHLIDNTIPPCLTDNWVVEPATAIVSNHLSRRFMGPRVSSAPTLVFSVDKTISVAGTIMTYTKRLTGFQPNTSYTAAGWASSPSYQNNLAFNVANETITTDSSGNATAVSRITDPGTTPRGTWTQWTVINETTTTSNAIVIVQA